MIELVSDRIRSVFIPSGKEPTDRSSAQGRGRHRSSRRNADPAASRPSDGSHAATRPEQPKWTPSRRLEAMTMRRLQKKRNVNTRRWCDARPGHVLSCQSHGIAARTIMHMLLGDDLCTYMVCVAAGNADLGVYIRTHAYSSLSLSLPEDTAVSGITSVIHMHQNWSGSTKKKEEERERALVYPMVKFDLSAS